MPLKSCLSFGFCILQLYCWTVAAVSSSDNFVHHEKTLGISINDHAQVLADLERYCTIQGSKVIQIRNRSPHFLPGIYFLRGIGRQSSTSILEEGAKSEIVAQRSVFSTNEYGIQVTQMPTRQVFHQLHDEVRRQGMVCAPKGGVTSLLTFVPDRSTGQ